jgi:hypothetical protein
MNKDEQKPLFVYMGNLTDAFHQSQRENAKLRVSVEELKTELNRRNMINSEAVELMRRLQENFEVEKYKEWLQVQEFEEVDIEQMQTDGTFKKIVDFHKKKRCKP